MKKGFILGLTTGVVLTGASLVLANSQIQAILNDQIKVTLNGQVQEFKDETTNETQYPITYHDRTYLPLRTVANLVGVDVDYDGNTNTAILKTKDYDELANDKLHGTEEIIYEDDKVVLKTINFDFIAESDLAWKYNWEPKVNVINGDSKLIIEWFGGNAKKDSEIWEDKFYLNNNVLSIADYGSEAGGAWYNTFNIDIDSGKLLSNEELLSIVGKNINEMKNYMIENYAKVLKGDMEENLKYWSENEVYANNLKEEISNVEYIAKEEFSWDNTYFYFNEKNELCCSSEIERRVMAGSGLGVYLYNISSNSLIGIKSN